ncbi:MAG: ABC transporter ATP-binding protein [Deltaproteobacteria bacterium]|nr:ABC transporter ATP-binding protein [Deltaproteobacteria bacterium]
MASVKIENLSISYGKTSVLENISLEINSGEFFFLLGPSGCGKTTLLRSIAGLGQSPSDGKIFIGEEDVTTLPAWKRTAPMVFQSYALWPHMTVLKNVMYGLKERKVPEKESHERAYEVLKKVKMDEYALRRPSELSGGQQQRVALARALVIEPKLILLDEPLSNLDASLRVEMRYELRKIHDQSGLTMLYVTHDQEEALSMADRIALMNRGNIEQIGSPVELFRKPVSKFAAAFMGKINSIPGIIKSVDEKYVTVSTTLGDFTADFKGDFKQSQEVEICIRPGDINSGVKDFNCFSAKCMSSFFYGGQTEHLVESGDTVLHVLSEENITSDDFYVEKERIMVFSK